MGTDEPRSSAAPSLVSSTKCGMKLKDAYIPHVDCIVIAWYHFGLKIYSISFNFSPSDATKKHFEAFACALSDGTVTTTIHQGTVRSGGNGWLQLTSFSK